MSDAADNILLEVGSTGLRRHGGYVYEEQHARLRGTQAVRVYREMKDNDPVIGAILWAIKMLCRAAEWPIQPVSDDPEAHRVAAWVDGCRYDMESTWQEFLSEALEMLVYGFAPFEKVYKIRRGHQPSIPILNSKFNDGAYGWRNLSIRSQDTVLRWLFDQRGNVEGFVQNAPPYYRQTPIPMSKIVNFRLETNKNNPEGRSILRNAYRSWYFLKIIQEIEAIGIERDLAGLPVMQVPARLLAKNASADDKSTLANYKDMVRNMKRNEFEGLVIPSELDNQGNPTGFKLSLLTSGGRRPIDVNEIVKRYESRIAVSVLGEFVLLGMDSVGSFALADSKTNLFAVAIGAIMDSICETFNRHLIPELLAVNNIPLELAPLLTHGDIETPSVAEFAQGLAAVVAPGIITPDNSLETFVRDYMGLPPREAQGAGGAAGFTMPIAAAKRWFRGVFAGGRETGSLAKGMAEVAGTRREAAAQRRAA